ncbi:hypothetical protein BTVI_01608 [Pitangus sulphuratus]|nr:hypothetical protein BTVI_01608 [Pitangus sulphuratus]
MVPVCLLGGRVAAGELILGSGCGLTSADRDGFQLEHPLLGCGTTLEDRQHFIHAHPSHLDPLRLHWRQPHFALAVFDSSWSSHLSHPSYSLGELINVQASLGTDPREALRVFVDKCVAIPGLSKWPEFRVIADNG